MLIASTSSSVAAMSTLYICWKWAWACISGDHNFRLVLIRSLNGLQNIDDWTSIQKVVRIGLASCTMHFFSRLVWAGTNQIHNWKPAQDNVSIDKIQNTDITVRCMPPTEQNHYNYWQFWQHFIILPFRRSLNPSTLNTNSLWGE